MRKVSVTLAAISAAALVSVGVLAAIGSAEPGGDARAVGSTLKRDTGAGELLLVVLGGVYASRAEAEGANAEMTFGDAQGYYVVPVVQFQGFREQLGGPGDFALVSVFRTEAGAEAFADAARMFGHPATILPTRVRSLGGLYAGLGQEASPEGDGPLAGPIPASLP